MTICVYVCIQLLFAEVKAEETTGNIGIQLTFTSKFNQVPTYMYIPSSYIRVSSGGAGGGGQK